MKGIDLVRMFGLGLIGLLAILLAGCAGGGRGGAIPYDVALARPDTPKPIEAIADKLAPLDTVSVYVYQVPDLSRDYTVDLAGNVSLPLIGQVPAVGLSTDELAAQLKQRFGSRYLQNPNITVSLKESQRRVVTVEGSVRSPGVFQATGPSTLLQVVALAKGLDEYANPHRIAIFRQIGGKRMAAAFDIVSIRRGEMGDPEVFPGDTVVVDGSSVQKNKRDLLQTIPVLAIFASIL